MEVLRGCFHNLGRLLVEFGRFSKLNTENISDFVTQDGLENYHEALRMGRGVIFMTAHFGAWELSSFAQSLFGYPMKFVVTADRQYEGRRPHHPLPDTGWERSDPDGVAQAGIF